MRKCHVAAHTIQDACNVASSSHIAFDVGADITSFIAFVNVVVADLRVDASEHDRLALVEVDKIGIDVFRVALVSDGVGVPRHAAVGGELHGKRQDGEVIRGIGLVLPEADLAAVLLGDEGEPQPRSVEVDPVRTVPKYLFLQGLVVVFEARVLHAQRRAVECRSLGVLSDAFRPILDDETLRRAADGDGLGGHGELAGRQVDWDDVAVLVDVVRLLQAPSARRMPVDGDDLTSLAVLVVLSRVRHVQGAVLRVADFD